MEGRIKGLLCLRVVLATFLVALIFCGTAKAAEQDESDPGDGIQVGDGTLYAGIEIELRHEDNFFYEQDGGTGSLITKISPRARLEYETEDAEVLALDLGLDQYFFEASSGDNYLNYYILGEYDYFPTERTFLYASLGYQLGHERRGYHSTETVPFSITEPHEYELWELIGRFKYGLEGEDENRLELEGRYRNFNYRNNHALTQYSERDEYWLTLDFFHNIMPSTRLAFTGRIRDFDYNYGNGMDSRELRLLFGLTWEATAQTTGFAKVGWKNKKFDVDSWRDNAGSSWEIGVNWQPFSYSTFTLITERDYEERYSTGDFLDISELSLEWNHQWSDDLTTLLDLSTQTVRFGNTDREDDVNSLGFEARYTAREWLNLGLRLRRTNHTSNKAGFGSDGNSIAVYVEIGYR